MDEKQLVDGATALAEKQSRVIKIEPAEQPQNMLLRVAAYTRVSSDSEDQLNSFAAQNRYYTELISGKAEWRMVDIYADEGITGTSVAKRDDFQRMMADCRRGLIDQILVKSISRFARNTNALLREAKEKIAALIGWLKDVKAELAKPQPPMLNDLLALHCANRNKGAYSNKAKNANLQRYAEAFSFLQSKKLYTVDDLDNALHAMQDKIDALKKSASAKQSRIKELDELLRMVDYYKSGKPAADKLKSIRFEKSRQKYKSEHDDELRTFYMAERKLKSYFKDGKLPITAWRREREQLEQEYKDIQTELSPLHADAKKLWAIHYNIYEVQHEQERQNTELRQKKQEMER